MAYIAPAEAAAALVDAWNEPDADAQFRLLSRACTDDVVYLDPHAPGPVEGRIALLSFLVMFRTRVPHRLEPTAAPQAHHGALRLPWRLADPEHGVFATGLLVALAAPDGRFSRLVHFVDAPAGAPASP